MMNRKSGTTPKGEYTFPKSNGWYFHDEFNQAWAKF